MATIKLLLVLLLPCGVTAGDVFTNSIRFHLGKFDQPKLFHIRNNLKGDVEFRESGNVTIVVVMSGNTEDKDRYRVLYKMSERNNTLVDLQVWLEKEPINWAMIGALSAGGFVLLVAVIIITCVCKRRSIKKTRQEQEKFQLKKLEKGKNVRDRLRAFERTKGEASDNNTSPNKPRSQTGTAKATASLFMMSLFTVVMAIVNISPKARIVIYVPSNMVKAGSAVYFNEEYHGRLLFSRDWKGDIKRFKQLAVPQAYSAVPTICYAQCKYCDANTKKCICLRGYKMIDGQCRDIDECGSRYNPCYIKSSCRNTNGSYTCVCPHGLWGDGVECKACTSGPCPKGFYESKQCTYITDRVCTACSPKCDKATYQQYGCGLTFDRKCIDISKPLVVASKKNITEIVKTRAGSKILVPRFASVLMENRLQVRSTNYSFEIKDGESANFSLHRNTGFALDVEVFDTHLTPRYLDYDGTRGSNNPSIASIPGFSYITSSFCRFPAQEYYNLNHKLHRKRQTKVTGNECRQPNTCPKDIEVGEKYYYREVNEPCRLAKNNLVCQPHANCRLPDSKNKLYCTSYVSILSNLFNIEKEEFEDKGLYEFDSPHCKNAFQSCDNCRTNNCSSCVDNDNIKESCSCCYRDCLLPCLTYYLRQCESRLKPKRCATGDVSEFDLIPKYGNDMRMRFNCYLRHDPPSTLYSIRYRVRHIRGTSFTSKWISKTQGYHEGEDHTDILDSLAISHSSKAVKQFYLRASRNGIKEAFKYSVAEVNNEREPIKKGPSIKKVQPKEPFLFHVGDSSWKKRSSCYQLDDWQSMMASDYNNFTSPQVRQLGLSKGAFSYDVRDAIPRLQLKIAKQESILKHVLNDSIIINDESFESKIERQNTTWTIQLKGKLRQCPSVIGLSVIDEVDHVKVIESDLLVLCPDEKFNVKLQVPRTGENDRERLFTIFLSDSQQLYKLQAAVVDRTSRSNKGQFKGNKKDTKREPWFILLPLFITTGCVLIALVALMIYAHKTVQKPPQMKLASASGWVWVQDSNKDKKDPNRLKRRHLILVVFVIVVRVVYSLVFTFSMAFAILTLLHADNMKIIKDYRSFVRMKVDESNSIALKMDQFREKEIKSTTDQAEDVQKACDYHLGVQMKWLQYNMSCTMQRNHVKMFNKLSKKIIDKVTAEVEILEKKVKAKIKKFSENTKQKLSHLKDDVDSYGRRVYNNKWFLLPKIAYKIAKGRRKRAIEAGKKLLEDKNDHEQIITALALDRNSPVLSRKRRSFSKNFFIGFLDFIGVLDQDKLAELERSINDKVHSMKVSFDDFKQIMASGTPPFLPLSTAFLCPIRHIAKKAKGKLETELPVEALKTLCQTSTTGNTEKNVDCLKVNVSRFCSAEDDDDGLAKNQHLDASSQRVYFEEASGIDSEQNVTAANRSSVIRASKGRSRYNIEKGDAFEEEIDKQKRKRLEKEGKLKQLGSIYDAQVFITLRKILLYIMGTIDILLLVYRSLKTYQIAMKLLYGFEEIVNHEQYEFHEPDTKEKIENIMRRILDIAAKGFAKFLGALKEMQKRVLRTNILPIMITIALGAVVIYLVIVIAFNVMNVTVIEELGGYRMVSAKLDRDLDFTNGALADHVKFLNDHDMNVYKTSITKTLNDYNDVLQDFAESEKKRFEDFNAKLCSIDNRTVCRPLTPDFPKMSFSPCIIPRFSAKKYEEYDGKEYRFKLKFESKKYVDALRNIFLDTVYFVIAMILLILLITVLTIILFFYMKSKDMIRVKYIHIYPTLPPELVKEYEFGELTDELVANAHEDSPQKVKIPDKFRGKKEEREC